MAESVETLVLVRFGQGFAAAMIIPIAQAYMGEISPLNSEGKYMGIFSVVLFCGFGIGPLMGGVLKDLYGVRAAFYVLSALVFLAFLLVCLFLPELRLHKKSPLAGSKTLLGMFRSRIVVGLITFRFTTAMCRGAIVAFVPILAHNNLHLSSSQIGVVITSSILSTSLLQMPFGVLADKVSRKKLVIVGGILLSGLILIFPLVTTFTGLLILGVFYGTFGALVLPPATAIMVEAGRIHGMGSAMSLFNMSMSLGLASGPLVAGWIADVSGMNCVFCFLSALGLVGIGFFALNCRRS